MDVALTVRTFGHILGLSLPSLIEHLVSTCSVYTHVTPVSVFCFASEAFTKSTQRQLRPLVHTLSSVRGVRCCGGVQVLLYSSLTATRIFLPIVSFFPFNYIRTLVHFFHCHYFLTLYSPVVTICTAQWSLSVPPVKHSTIPRSTHTVYLCALCGSENKQRLFPYTALTDWLL